MADGHKPTSGMKSAAARALAWHKDGKRGGTIVGFTRANQIVNGTALSDSTVKRMYSFFSRHEVDKKATGFSAGEEGYPSPGRVAWDLWGGDSGYSWSRKIVNQMKNKDMKKMMKLSVGDTVSWNSSGGKATGKITRIVVSGKINVPGSSFTITGTKENPAALIRLYRDGKPTDTYVGHKLNTLRSSGIKKADGEMPEDIEPSDELANLNERQVHQYEYYESLANDFGLFKQDTSADGAHYSSENPFKSEGLMCQNCVFFEEGACEIVEGNISPEGICKLWIIPEEKLSKAVKETDFVKSIWTGTAFDQQGLIR